MKKKIDVTSNKGKVKNLDIPATLGGAPVTQIGYDYITRDANSGDDFDEFGQTVFVIYVEEAHNCDGAFEDIHSITKLKTVRVSKSNHVLYAKDNMLIKK